MDLAGRGGAVGLCGGGHPDAGVHLVRRRGNTLCATFAAYAGVSLTVQLLIFVAVSIAACAAVRPLAQRYVAPNVVPTNADRLLGCEARVTEDIDNEGPTGAVYVDGKTWTARSAGGQHLPAGTVVEIEGMEGVKLIVRARAAVEESA